MHRAAAVATLVVGCPTGKLASSSAAGLGDPAAGPTPLSDAFSDSETTQASCGGGWFT